MRAIDASLNTIGATSAVALDKKSSTRQKLKSGKSATRLGGVIMTKTKVERSSLVPSQQQPISSSYRTRKDPTPSEFKTTTSIKNTKIKSSAILDLSVTKESKGVLATKKVKKTPLTTARIKLDKAISQFDFEVFKLMSTGKCDGDDMRDDFHLFCEFLLLLNVDEVIN